MLKLHYPSNTIVSGPSQVGKSFLVLSMIRNNVYNHEIKKVLWCYHTFQKWFLDEKNIQFRQGLPKEGENADLIVIDDQMNNITNEVATMFTVGSHHEKYSIILITQNLFPRVKQFRDISLNAHYLILFRNNRDQSQASCFARQAFPGKVKYFMDAYKKATEKEFSYLLVDVHPKTTEQERLRQSLFPEHGFINWVFLPLEK